MRRMLYSCLLGDQGWTVHFYTIIRSNNSIFLRTCITPFIHWWQQEQLLFPKPWTQLIICGYTPSPSWVNQIPAWEFSSWYCKRNKIFFWVATFTHIMRNLEMLGAVFSIIQSIDQKNIGSWFEETIEWSRQTEISPVK